jgi:hypothetical protein
VELGGGSERVFYQTAQGLRDPGHEIHLFCQNFCIRWPSLSQQARSLARQYIWNTYHEKFEQAVLSHSSQSEPEPLIGEVALPAFSRSHHGL